MKSAIRRFIGCFAGFVLLSTGFAAMGQNKSVLDYYRLLKPDMLGGSRFTFTKKGNTWKTSSPFTDAEIECTVDLKNGYIEVSDHGTGGGTLTQEVALFINKKGERFIGVNITSFDGVGISHDCKFYRWTGKRWAAAAVLPHIPLEKFFKPGFTLSSVKDRVSLSYDLPRTGTTVKAALDVSRLQMMMSEHMGFGPEDAKKAKRALANVAYSSIELNWNMARGEFTIGKKLK